MIRSSEIIAYVPCLQELLLHGGGPYQYSTPNFNNFVVHINAYNIYI